MKSSGDLTLNHPIVNCESAVKAYASLPQAFKETFTDNGSPGNAIVAYMIPLKDIVDDAVQLMY